MSRHVGSVEAGKLADLVLWSPAFFGVKPDLVVKGGTIAAAPMGDPNASIPTPQPVHYRPMFGAFGKARTATSLTFVSQAALAKGVKAQPRARQGARRGRERARRHLEGDRWCTTTRRPTSRSIPRPTASRADGELLVCEPAEVLPMAQRYFLF